jgi:hypothetical protein
MKSLTPLLAAMLGAALPHGAAAQRGLPGAIRGRMSGPTRDSGVVMPRQVSAINLLVARRQDLELGDSQFVHIIALKRALDSTNAPLLRKADSVERLFKGRPIFASQSPAHRDSVRAGRTLVQEIAELVRENDDAYRDRAYALLSAEQLRAAQTYEAEARRAP